MCAAIVTTQGRDRSFVETARWEDGKSPDGMVRVPTEAAALYELLRAAAKPTFTPEQDNALTQRAGRIWAHPRTVNRGPVFEALGRGGDLAGRLWDHARDQGLRETVSVVLRRLGTGR
jgi:hypothetical protein